jgi:hypothetical protein
LDHDLERAVGGELERIAVPQQVFAELVRRDVAVVVVGGE